MASFFIGMLDRVFAVGGALLLAQTPMFMQQYSMQLIGRVAELKLQVDGMIKAATFSSRSLQEYIQRFIDSGDPDFSRQGELMMGMVDRYEQLFHASQSLTTASVVSKPFVFVRDMNWEMMQTTLSDFQPGIPFTLEGLVYGLIGIGVGYSLFGLCSFLGTKMRSTAKRYLDCFVTRQ